MENRLIFDSHPPEDVMEEYAFNRLAEEHCADLEEHLLICPRCQDRLARTDEFIQLMKQATAQWHGEPRPKVSSGMWWGSPLAAILGAGVVTAALALAIPHSWRPARESAPVELVAFRGGAGTAMVRARAGAAIGIVIDATDLDHRHNLRVEVVDAGGKPVWSGPAAEAAAGARISARIGAPLSAGVYWIRLYSPDGELLREFGLRAE